MSLAANALTNLATLKSELNISVSTHDTYLERVINATSDFVAQWCNRTFHFEETIVEDVAGYGTNNLLVSRTPIVTIDSITYDGGVVSASDYEVSDAAAGIIYAPKLWIWTGLGGSGITHLPRPGTERKLYTVTYDGGYVTEPQVDGDPQLTRTLPYDLEDAVLQIAVYRYRQRGRDQSVQSESLLNASVSYKLPFVTGDAIKTLMPQVYTTLCSYKRETML